MMMKMMMKQQQQSNHMLMKMVLEKQEPRQGDGFLQDHYHSCGPAPYHPPYGSYPPAPSRLYGSPGDYQIIPGHFLHSMDTTRAE